MIDNKQYAQLPEITVTPHGNSFEGEYPNMLPEVSVVAQRHKNTAGIPTNPAPNLSNLANKEGLNPGRFRIPRGHQFNYTPSQAILNSANKYQQLLDSTNANPRFNGWKNWMHDWYSNRLDANNFDQNDLAYLDRTLQNTGILETSSGAEAASAFRNAGFWNAVRTNNPAWSKIGVNTAHKIYPMMRNPNVGGFSLRTGNFPIILKPQQPGYRTTSPIHELTHATDGIGQADRIKEIVGDQQGYFSDPREIYARMNEIRQGAGLDPNKTYNYRKLRRAARRNGLIDVFTEIRRGVNDTGRAERRKIKSLFRDIAYNTQPTNDGDDVYLA